MSLDEMNGDRLMRQAAMTAEFYMGEGISYLEKRFGDNFPPELLAAYMQTAAMDYAAGLQRQGINRIAEQLDSIASELGALSTTVGELK